MPSSSSKGQGQYGRPKFKENDACLAYVFTYGWWITRRPAGLGASDGSSADCKLGLTPYQFGLSLLSGPETLGDWTDGRIHVHTMSWCLWLFITKTTPLDRSFICLPCYHMQCICQRFWGMAKGRYINVLNNNNNNISLVTLGDRLNSIWVSFFSI